jgi:uncharacterized membrane protein (UPF0136 family)
MNKPSRARRDISVGVLIVIGLVIGFLIKKVHVGLLIGIGLGLLAGAFLSNRK